MIIDKGSQKKSTPLSCIRIFFIFFSSKIAGNGFWQFLRSTIREGGRIDRNHREIGEWRGSVIKSAIDCYTKQTVQILCMSVDLNVMHISTNRCLIVWTKEWVKKVTELKRRQRDGFSGLHTFILPDNLYHPQNPLHNLYDTGLSSASSIGIIHGG